MNVLGGGQSCLSQLRNPLERGCYGIVFYNSIILLFYPFIQFFVPGFFCALRVFKSYSYYEYDRL